ncbi:hypothetical protein AVEN_55107-1 [Araneus ventricosus]|uniref:Uncharacterized protein n=1 Tax=Araneus ventricosus TaxID=182803 RepID=A0A4Y2SF28_ARAVE|nr:hypothetical protein AVEN_256167-1 [Araneus ventricosus]GBN86471.1 hypothetical protein AVEN_55107-1 [Araneus ventricosus]
MDMVFTKNTNYSLPNNFFPSRSSSSATTNLTPVQRNVPLCDRISNAALILGVIAEHNLPFSMAPVLVNVSKALAEDKKALNHLSLSRNCTSYKMKFGVAKIFLQDTLKNLQTIKFLLNLDESTSYNNIVMRGTKSGVETRIRKEKAPHLLNIDDDSCCHIHNASKKFYSLFDCWLENLTRDIFNDTKWSAGIRDWLIEICSILNLKYISPVNVISHRWLSCYDAALNLLHMIEPLTILYSAFLSNSDKTVFFYNMFYL